MIERVFWNGFWFGLCLIGAVYNFTIYYFLLQHYLLLIGGGVLILGAFLIYNDYINFLEQVRMSLHRKPRETDTE